MQTFDLIVIGAGSGLNVASATAAKGMKVAIVEKGPMGGTCLNRGCIPSKILIESADVAEFIKKSSGFGIKSKITSIDFKSIVSKASRIVDKEARDIKEGILKGKNTTLFNAEAKFIGERTLKAGSETITGGKIIIAAGTRPSVPKIDGLGNVKFMTSDEALRLKKLPKTLTILGGGYIAAELAHFFGSLGSKINIIQHNPVLVPNEDEEIAIKFTEVFRKKYSLFLDTDAVGVHKKGKSFVVDAKGPKGAKKIISDSLLVATGRTPNTDSLDVAKTGVEVNQFGYIKTNDFLETTCPNIWALGDIAGKYLFKHSANLEAQYAYNNAVLGQKIAVDYSAMPHAIFSSPQVAGVGMREQDLKEKKMDYAAGKYEFIKTGMGLALQDKDGFVKIFADRRTKKILGCHIIGMEASTLIHEVVLAMKNNLTTDAIRETIHVHPALSEVVQRAVNSIRW